MFDLFARQISHSFVRGLHLYSTATQTPQGAALASPYNTSWESEDSTGPSDKWPVLAQHAESEALLTSYAVLPWSLESHPPLSSGTWLAAQAGNPRAVSPCTRWDACQQCLVRQQGTLAQAQCSIDVRKKQAETPAGDGHPPHA
jgi:hypothetical protein